MEHVRKARGKPRGLRRDRDCRTCKGRGVKCDLNRPGCNVCAADSLTCAGYPARVVWKNDRSQAAGAASEHYRHTRRHSGTNRAAMQDAVHVLYRSQSLSVDSNGLLQDTPDLKLRTRVPNRKHILAKVYNYLQNINTVDDGGGDQDKSPVKETSIFRVWAYAWAHLLSHSHESNGNREASLTQHTAAIMSLSEAVTEDGLKAVFGIAVFAFLDVCEGRFGQWHCHLNGARSLLDVYCPEAIALNHYSCQLDGLREIVAHLAWFDVIGAIIREDRHLIFEDWHRQAMDDKFFCTVGCPGETFSLFVAIARLEDNQELHTLSCQAMDQYLHETITDTSAEGWSKESQKAWRCAGLVVYTERIHAGTMSFKQGVLYSLVQAMCDCIEIIPVTSHYYLHLAAVAYIASRQATEAKHLEILRAYWRQCCGFPLPHYKAAYEHCEILWARKLGVANG